jgi:hypothetical protein
MNALVFAAFHQRHTATRRRPRTEPRTHERPPHGSGALFVPACVSYSGLQRAEPISSPVRIHPALSALQSCHRAHTPELSTWRHADDDVAVVGFELVGMSQCSLWWADGSVAKMSCGPDRGATPSSASMHLRRVCRGPRRQDHHGRASVAGKTARDRSNRGD